MYISYFEKNKILNENDFANFLMGIEKAKENSSSEEWKTVWTNTPPWRNNKLELELTRITRLLYDKAIYLDKIIPVENRFRSFRIPKKTGGYRLIEEPCWQLKDFLREVKENLEQYFLPHPSAYAYIANRSCFDAMKKHQKAKNKWFLKLDFHDFFGSTTQELLMDRFWKIYPFAMLKDRAEMVIEWNFILSLAFAADGHLPQGTPLSPLITNMCMISSDYVLGEYCKYHQVCYTRYADDLLFSSKDRESLKHLVWYVNQVTPDEYKLNKKKTRLGSIAGSNWNLGLMLNKDNNITVGKENKDVMRATLWTWAMKLKDNPNLRINQEEKLKFEGLFNYYRHIEPIYFDHLINKVYQKSKINLYLYFNLSRK